METQEDLVERARDGDATAFTALLRTHDAAMRGLVWSVVHDQWLMDDILQTAYEKAFRKIRTFRGESSFRTWLHRICWTTALDALRYERYRRHAPIEEHENRPATGDDPEATSIRRITWESAWRQLTHDQRTALTLVIGQGLTHDEAAVVCGTRPGTIASRICRARERLRELLEDDATRETQP